jgi:hypothetical protein
MAQHDYVISNGSGSAVRSDLNNALAAIVSINSGASEPGTTYSYQLWADTTAGVLKFRNGANNAWITLRELDGTLVIEAGTVSAPGLYFSGDTNTGIYSPGADQFAITTNGVERVEYGTSAVVFNDGGADYDFRVEGDTNANLLFVDASTDRVGVGTNSPATRLDVDGDVTIRSQGDLRFGDSDNSNWVALQAPATVASNVTFTLPATDGTADQVLKTNGSAALGWTTATQMTLATAQSSTSGTSIDFTSIPSWVKRITVMFDGVSTNSTSPMLMQLGDSGGFETSSYNGANSVTSGGVASVAFSSGFLLTVGTPYTIAASAHSGAYQLSLIGSNTWTINGGIAQPTTPYVFVSCGSKTLSATLDRIRVTTVNGTDAFDAGSINILYEG